MTKAEQIDDEMTEAARVHYNDMEAEVDAEGDIWAHGHWQDDDSVARFRAAFERGDY